MKYCIQCGQELSDEANFCFKCGHKAINEESRKTIYEGEMRKCPQCGQILNAFEVVCPSCQFELRGADGSQTVNGLLHKLEHATSEEQRILIIKNYPVPNTKEDIYELMILALSNFDVTYHLMHSDKEDLSDAWLSKIEQCYQKARFSFRNKDDFSGIEEIYLKVQKDISDEEKRLRSEYELNRFKKSIFRKVLIVFIVFSAICVVVSIDEGNWLCTLVAMLMAVMQVCAYLIGSKIIKTNIRSLHSVLGTMGMLMLIPFIFVLGTTDDTRIFDYDHVTNIVWEDFTMGDELPNFGKTSAEVVCDSQKSLILFFYEIKSLEFEEYIDQCKEFGYTIDVEYDEINYIAYNEKGYRLHLQYFDTDADERLTIILENPKDKTTIAWPINSLVKDVPVPQYLVGEVICDNESRYAVYLVDVPDIYLSEYGGLCIESGFEDDYTRTDTYYYGKNKDGIGLTVEMIGYNTLYISVSRGG